MAGNAGHVMNLANSIIGVGLLAMPFCFKQCGITLAILMLIFSSVISRLACHFLVKSSALCRRRNFEFLAFYTFGPSGKLLVDLGVIGFMMGTCVAFFVVMGDLGPAIISKIFNLNNDSTLRTTVLLALGILVVLPLGLLRNIESLIAISTATIGFYFLFTLKIFLESSHQLLAGDWWYHVNFWNPEGVLQCIPIFAMSLSCQTQLFEIYESLPAPTMDKINSIVHSAINLCTVVYASVGFLGYVAYCKGTFTGNILLSFTPSFSSEVFKLGFVLSIAVSFPLVIFPCRASLYSLIYKRIQIHHETGQTSSHMPDARFKWLTITIVMVSLVTGLLIPSIELVLGFVGSTIGIAICVIFPSLSYLNLNSKNANDKMIAKATVIIGVLIMIMGTFGNLYAAIENSATESNSGKFVSPKHWNELKAWPRKDDDDKLLKKEISGKSFKAAIPPVDEFNVALGKKLPSEGIIHAEKLQDNRRKEPPIPVAPVLDIKLNRKIVVSEVKEREERDPKKWEAKSRRVISVPIKFNENISKDAIEKENREILEVEKQKKADENGKDEELELLKVLKAHQDEQKKLLMEQKKILNEIKIREMKNEKKLNEVLQEEPHGVVEVRKLESKLEGPKPVVSDGKVPSDVNRTKSNIPSPGQTNSKGKENKSVVQKKPPAKQKSSLLDDPVVKEIERVHGIAKNKNLSAPQSLRVSNDHKEEKMVELKQKSKVPIKPYVKMNPDNLKTKVKLGEKNLTREKREVEVKREQTNDKCLQGDKQTDEKVTGVSRMNETQIKAEDASTLTDPKVSDLIKNAKHLSITLNGGKKPNEDNYNQGDEYTKESKLSNDLLTHSVIGKKRYFKSFV